MGLYPPPTPACGAFFVPAQLMVVGTTTMSLWRHAVIVRALLQGCQEARERVHGFFSFNQNGPLACEYMGRKHNGRRRGGGGRDGGEVREG